MKELIPEQYSLIEALVRAQGNACAIVGGAVRDLRQGVVPKDYDIAVLSLGGFTAQSAFTAAGTLSSILSSLGYSTQCFYAYGLPESQFSNMWSCCLKVQRGGLSIDLLFANEDSLQEVVSAFDFNMNQVAYTTGQGYTPYWEHDPDLTLVQCSTCVDIERVERMRTKYMQLFPKGVIV